MKLKGKRVAMLVADFYQPLEFWYPYYRLKEEGAEVKVVCRGESHMTRFGNPSPKRDVHPSDAREADFDAVVIPGGYAPDTMRDDEDLVRFVREMNDAGKIVAAVCHGPWVPISAGIVKGRTMTCFPAMRDDVTNAGAKYVEQEAVRDRNLVTSRDPDTLPAFFREIVAAFSGKLDMKLKGKKIAILVDDFYQIFEFWYPYHRMKEDGADVKVISREESHMSGDALPGRYPSAKRDVAPSEARAVDFDAVVIPGGYAPDFIRNNKDLVRFVREMNEAGKVVAAICHGPWVPISAGIVNGRTMTCAKSIRVDVTNAGAHFVDKEVVRDRNLVTSRKPDDLPAFCREIIAALSGTQQAVEIQTGQSVHEMLVQGRTK